MSVSSTTRKAGPFTGDGVNVAFPFAFKVFQASDVLVVLTDTNGTDTTQTLTSQYTVSLNANQDANPGGTVTMITAPAANYKLTLASQVPYSQATVLTNTGGFFPTVINDALDKLTILVQQLFEKLSRTLTVSISTPAGVSTSLPAPSASKVIGWSGDATSLVNYDAGVFASAVQFANWQYNTYTGDGVTTTFVLSGNPTVAANMDVSLHGVTQVPDTDFTVSGTSLVFNVAPPNGVKILARYGLAAQQAAIGQTVETKTATAGQTVFTLSTSYIIGTNALAVFLNGVRLTPLEDYVETSTTSVTLTTGATVGDKLLFAIGATATAGTTLATSVAYTPAGTGAVPTDVQTQLRNIYAYGNGINVFAVDMPPYNGNLSAALDAATDGTVLLLGMRDYNIVGKFHNAVGGPYVGNQVKNLKIFGAGMPQVSADGTRFVSGSGTVIQGTLLNYADGFEAYNLGVDVGTYVNATYNFGGYYPEGFVPGTHKFQGTPTDLTTYIQNVAFANIKVLAVNNLNHAILCEFINGLSHGYCEAIGGYHGYVCKSTNVVGGNVWAYGQAGDGYIIKSDQYTRANNISINSITLGKRGYATRTAPGYFQSTTGGHVTSRVSIGSINGWHCQELLTRIGDPESITDIMVGSIMGDDIVGNGVSILGDMRRIQIGKHVISNPTANGVYVDSTTGESIDIGGGIVTNAGASGYYFAGFNHTHGDIKSINAVAYGVNHVSGFIDMDRVGGSGNASGLMSSGYELINTSNLLNSWVNNTGTWPFQVVLNGRTVHVRGTVKNGTTGIVAQLPAGYRPSAVLSFLTVALNTAVSRVYAHVDIDTSGNITVSNFAGAAPGLGGTGCVVAFNFSYLL